MATLPPPRRATAAGSGAGGGRGGPPRHRRAGGRDVAADLAAPAGRPGRRAGTARSGGVRRRRVGRSGGWRRRSATLQPGRRPGRAAAAEDAAEAELTLIEALALAGRVDEAAAAGTRLIGRLGDDPATRETRIEAHLRLAHAAVSASRWPMARHHIEAAVALVAAGADPNLSARAAVLSAEVALADDDLDGARRTAEQVLAMDGAGPDVRCHALEIVGRSAAARPARRRCGLRGGAGHRRAGRPAGMAAEGSARAGHRRHVRADRHRPPARGPPAR